MIKRKRQKEASEFQEEGQLNFQDLPDEQDQSLHRRPTKAESLQTEIDHELQFVIKSPLLNLTNNEKKTALQWLDFKRNAAILEKIDQAIEEKLKAKKAFLPLDNLAVLDLNKEQVFNETEHDLGFNEHEEENSAYMSRENKCEDYIVNGHSGPYLRNQVSDNLC